MHTHGAPHQYNPWAAFAPQLSQTALPKRCVVADNKLRQLGLYVGLVADQCDMGKALAAVGFRLMLGQCTSAIALIGKHSPKRMRLETMYTCLIKIHLQDALVRCNTLCIEVVPLPNCERLHEHTEHVRD